MEILVKEFNYKWLRNCYVGVTQAVVDVSYIQEKLRIEGFGNRLVRPIDGQLVLFSILDKEELEGLESLVVNEEEYQFIINVTNDVSSNGKYISQESPVECGSSMNPMLLAMEGRQNGNSMVKMKDGENIETTMSEETLVELGVHSKKNGEEHQIISRNMHGE
ncbi:hypothetical protein Ancab_035834 [Ancistrocladus abbreviatus]